jgi:hypothetical protein
MAFFPVYFGGFRELLSRIPAHLSGLARIADDRIKQGSTTHNSETARIFLGEIQQAVHKGVVPVLRWRRHDDRGRNVLFVHLGDHFLAPPVMLSWWLM